MILHMGGGGAKELAIKVIGGTVQPTGAAGMLWCNTATTIPKWTFAVAAPVSPATGDLWMQTDAVSTRLINLLKRNGAIVNLTRVKQWNGTVWLPLAASYHDGSAWAQVSSAFNPTTDITYTGSYTLIDDGGGHWRIKFYTSGTLRFSVDPGTTIDLFLAGAGGASNSGGGAGGGYTLTHQSITVTVGVDYPIVVGAGGTGSGAGGTSTGMGYSATGGNGTSTNSGAAGGSGGGTWSGGNGGSDGSNGTSGTGGAGGTGQGTTTREFGAAGGTLYSSGGASSTGTTPGTGAGSTSAAANTGDGAGGSSGVTHSGGSGIAVVRDHRAA